MQPTKTQAIKNFLLINTHPDLAGLYNHDMEVQVNVGQDGGRRIDGEFKGRQWHGYTDDLTTWKTFRIPWNAYSDPEYVDKEITFDLSEHAEGIGMTGWDWKNRVSRWVAFDFDAITGHSERHAGRLLDSELAAVEAAAQKINWVTVRRSTSGSGLHLYVFLDAVPTANHTEHQALGRAILSMMSGMVGFDFTSKVDQCGGNMWCWHRKMRGTDGLELIKKGGILEEIPDNWRDHLKVITGRKAKVVPAFIEDSEVPDAERMFEELTGQRAHVTFDDEHKQLMNWLRDNGHTMIYDSDHHMIITHTYSLKRAHDELELRGIFGTVAEGRHTGDYNCFCFPLRRGAWVIRRYSQGIVEAESWDQDSSGWTRCFYNQEPDLQSACRSNSGVEHPSGGFVFTNAEDAQRAALSLGTDLGLHATMCARGVKFKEHKDGRLIVEVKYENTDDPNKMKGWINEGKAWKRVFNVQTSLPTSAEVGNYDDIVRHIVTSSGEDYGWVLKTDGQWRTEPLTDVRTGMQYFGLSGKETTNVLGSSVFKPWTLVNYPFQPEYLGDRTWNRNSPQLKYAPSQEIDRLSYPTWVKILNHLGQGLDEAVKMNGWAKANGILTGADYLKCWIASLFQEPNQPLPYLFLYSKEQNTGKSIFHEAISLLMTHGVVRGDTALLSQSGFNAELENSVLCVIEETDLKRNKSAANTIKDWVTSPKMTIHRKGQTPYSIPNTTHWVHAANDHNYCPIFTGDSRITVIQVMPIDPSELIPKKQLIPMLQKEAPDFLAALLNLEIPPSNDRLNVPVIDTIEKESIEHSNETLLEMFLRENCYHVTGSMIAVKEFFERFQEWCPAEYISEWSKIRIGREMPPQYCKGRSKKNAAWYYGNISWEPRRPGEPILPKLTVKSDYLISIEELSA